MAFAAPALPALAVRVGLGGGPLAVGSKLGKYFAEKGASQIAGSMVASALGGVLPAIGDGLESVGGVAKSAGQGIASAAKKVGSAFKKAFRFQEGGRVRRPPTTAPPAYRRGGKVKHFNAKPRKLYEGGRVTRRRSMTDSQVKGDSVRALLQPGELVIPVTHYQRGRKPVKLADLTAKALKRSGIKLPGM